MHKLSLILLFVIVFSKSFAQVSEQEISVNSKTATLSGSLVIPESTHKMPVVLIIAGSGPTDRNCNASAGLKTDAYKLLANDLAQKNIASLRYDKRVVGKSTFTNKPEEMVFGDFVDDADALVNYLQELKKFSKIVILGHSEGALTGLLVAQKHPKSLYVSLAGAGVPIDSVLKWQLAKQPIVYKPSLPIIDSLKNGYHVNTVPPLLKGLFAPTVQNFLMSWMKYDPRVELAKLKSPSLIIQGTHDIQVDIFNAESLKKASPKSELVLINGMNHILKDAPKDFLPNVQTYSKPELPLHPDLMLALVKFIREN